MSKRASGGNAQKKARDFEEVGPIAPLFVLEPRIDVLKTEIVEGRPDFAGFGNISLCSCSKTLDYDSFPLPHLI